jgi:hypothetical protein
MQEQLPALLEGLARAKSPGVDLFCILSSGLDEFEVIALSLSVTNPRIRLDLKAI